MVRSRIIANSVLILAACASDPGLTYTVRNDFDVQGERIQLAREASAVRPGRQPIVIVYGDENELADLHLPAHQRILDQFYVVKLVRVTHSYEREYFYKYWARKFNRGEWDVTYDYYLTVKDYPYTPSDLLVFNRLGVTKTPALFMFDRSLQMIYSSQGGLGLSSSRLLQFATP